MKSFTYLGSEVNLSACFDEIAKYVCYLCKTTDKFHLWNEKDIKLETKVQVYKADILTTLLYGPES